MMLRPDEEQKLLLQLYDALQPLKDKFEKAIEMNYMQKKVLVLNVEQAQILYPLYQNRYKEILMALESLHFY